MRFILGFVVGAAVYCWLDKTEKPAAPAAPVTPIADAS